MAITGIPTTRVSDLFIRQRLLSQVQFDQRELFRLQTQISTGQRILVPSEDADAALRVMGLQRLLERKEQIETNVVNNQSFLTASDSALAGVSGALVNIRAVALGAIGDTVSDAEREAAAQQVQQTIRHLLDVGNQKFRGRYLFAGTGTMVQPFEATQTGLIEYLGNEGRLSSYSDVDRLFDTNVHGSEVFGAISEDVLGSADLNPVLTFNTRLADLRGGLGITSGSIAVSDGTTTSIIDISGAQTVSDVAAMIRANPPEAKTLDVQITPTGLVIELNGLPGDLLSIREVGGGTTASELGILTETPTGDSIAGGDLDPMVRLTTRADDIFGSRARAVVRSTGTDNDLIFEAPNAGTSYNGIQIVFVDDGSVLTAGVDEVASYDGPTNTLTVTVKTGATKAAHVVAAVQTAFAAGDVPLTARLDPLDEQNDGQGIVSIIAPGQYETDYGGGFSLDKDSGLQIVNGNQTHSISFAGADTVEDIVNVLNISNAGVLAEINRDATGINIRSRVSGGDFMIGENGGTTATDLGLRTFTDATQLEDLNYGRGVDDHDGTDFTITRTDGVTIDIDVSGLETIGEVRDLINGLAGGTLEARLAAYGNGIELVDDSPGPELLTVTRADSGRAAVTLGLVAEGDQSSTAGMIGTSQVLAGADVNPSETEGVFAALLRLQAALRANDEVEAQRAFETLDWSMTSLNFARAELGARQQSLDVMQMRLESEEINLRAALSEDFDADLAEVISEFTGRQIAYEASLQSTASIFQMTLLDYL